MSEINLIANSGLQFITYKLALGLKGEAMKVSRDFAEIPELVGDDEEVFLREPYYYSAIGKYIRYDELNTEAKDPVSREVYEDKVDADFVKVIPMEYINTVSARETLECFENTWIPVPFLRFSKTEESGNASLEFHGGPNSWSRMFISSIPELQKESGFTHYLVLAFDTTCRLDEDNDREWWFPKLSNKYDNHFKYKCDWQDKELAFTEYNQELIRKAFDRKPDFHSPELYFKEVQLYLTLLDVLQRATWSFKDQGLGTAKHTGFPNVTLHDPVEESINVALILDIGNARTCGILAEISDHHAPFDITKSVPLQIRDFSRPYQQYHDPFSMQVAMVKPPFDGDDNIFDTLKPFTWPSICRVGPEAGRYATIYSGIHSNSHLSSPKRYLWDLDAMPDSWEYMVKGSLGVELAIDEVLTPELTVDGRNLKIEDEKKTYDSQDSPTIPAIDKANFSRSSLMKLALVEIFLQAISQVNSIPFRDLSHKKIVRRKINKIVLTCPTAMLRTERFILREHADNAIDLLKDIYASAGNGGISDDLQIVPNPRFIYQPTNTRKASTWEYDEATCSQITFLYSEIKDRFKDPNLFINSLGKKRGNALFPEKPALTIASVDIGGGTTDLMIATYQTDPSSAAIIPKPLFWESFNLAGDNILKSVIERIVIPAIHDYAKAQTSGDMGVVANAMLELFGSYTGHQRSSDIRMLKRHIVNQVLIPIATEILQFLKKQNTAVKLTYKSVFEGHNSPNPRIVQYINKTFQEYGLKEFDITLLEIEVDYESTKGAVVEILKYTIPQLCSVISQFHCDFVLLAGRPTNLPVVREFVLQYLPTSPDKIIQLGDYWMGEWYPFIKGSGYINDSKTCVSVGALIALLSGEMGVLSGFSLDLTELSKVESTADYIGQYKKPYLSKINVDSSSEKYIEKQDKSFRIDFFDHVDLGMKQIDHDQWISAKMYEIRKASAIFEQYKNLQPFTLELSRQNPLNPEEITLKKITAKNGRSLDLNTLKLRLNTLEDEYGYWLDTGIFNIELISE